jgi:hypothetical protein
MTAPRGRRAGPLWQSAAQAVSGQPVAVRWAVPAILGADGTAGLDESGKPVITIRPGLKRRERWRVFLHECAHVALGHMRALADIGPVGAMSPGEVSRWQFAERAAWHLAGVLGTEADRRAGRSASDSAKLRALIDANRRP